MRITLIWLPVTLCAATLGAQAPAARVHTSGAGFSYSIPSDWEVVDTQQAIPSLRQQANQDAKSEDEKKGIGCSQLELTARHGEPASVIAVMALPYDCFGQAMTDKDLPGFVEGATEGMKQSLDISNPVYGTYSLGSHSLWIERAQGAPKGHPDLHYTVEVACSLLKKAAVCWMVMAADADSLRSFEGGAVTLDGESHTTLVPPAAFEKKPS